MDSNFGIDWDGPVPTEEDTVTVDPICCPVSPTHLSLIEDRFDRNYIFSSQHHAVDRYVELLNLVTTIVP